MTVIVLPFPPAGLSGHAKGHWRTKAALTKKHREWGRLATLEAKATAPAEGDIALHVRFVPPHNRGDRTNYPARLKASLDGIADALGVNDRRFIPTFTFAPAEKPGRVEITITPQGAE